MRAPFVVIAIFLFAQSSFAEDASDKIPARDFYRPRDPIVLLAPAFGGGGFNSSSRGGGAGPSLRVDVEALDPLWFSATGRTLFTGPIDQSTFDFHVGYELRHYRKKKLDDGTVDRARVFFRPIVGFKAFRYAAPNSFVASSRAVEAQVGIDWTVVLKDKKWGTAIWRAHVNGGVSFRGHPGIEAETTWGIGIRERSLAGPFVGAFVGTVEPLGGYGGLELGFAYEL